ncbi:MAG: outer membrane beta-barrel protein [bacterium]
MDRKKNKGMNSGWLLTVSMVILCSGIIVTDAMAEQSMVITGIDTRQIQNDRSAPSRGGQGFRLGENTTFSPFVEGSYTYDSNVGLLPKGQKDEDWFSDLVAGGSLLRLTDWMSANLRMWWQTRNYQDHSALNDDTWQENFDSVFGDRRHLAVILNQKHSDVSDYEFTQSDSGARNQEDQAVGRLLEGRTMRVPRTLDDVGAAVGHDTDKLEMQFGGNYGAADFKDPKIYDFSEESADLNLGYKSTDKTTETLTLSYGGLNSDNGLSDTSYWKARLGIRTRTSYKTSISAGMGYQQMDSTMSTGQKLQDEAFHYDVAASWAVTEKLTLQAFGRNEILPTMAYRDNTQVINQFSLGAIQSLTDSIFTSLGASYRRDNFSRFIDDKKGWEELRGFQWRLEYENPRHILRAFGSVGYEEYSSNIQDPYDQLRVMLGVSLTY